MCYCPSLVMDYTDYTDRLTASVVCESFKGCLLSVLHLRGLWMLLSSIFDHFQTKNHHGDIFDASLDIQTHG